MHPIILQPFHYRPIETVFNLLCVCQQAETLSIQALRRAYYRRQSEPDQAQEQRRLPFWLHLCQAAGLLDEQFPPVPTLLVSDWLALHPGEQLRSLVEAWLWAPAQESLQQRRNNLLERLMRGEMLLASQQRELAGLSALGICVQEQLTDLGRAVIHGEFGQIEILFPKVWTIDGDRLIIPFPPEWDLVWELEAYLQPLAPGVYPLDMDAFRAAAQRGAWHTAGRTSLVEILARGLGVQPPSRFLENLANRPTIRALPGPVLEFSDPQELLDLRQSPSWRRELEDVLSPRHVHLDPWYASAILRRLYRKGLLSLKDMDLLRAYQPGIPLTDDEPEQPDESPNNTSASLHREGGLSKADRAYLLALFLFGEGAQIPFSAPLGLAGKLVNGLEHPLRAAAARKATLALNHLFPRPPWVPEDEPPLMPQESLLEILRQTIDREETIDILYQADKQSQPEYRHLTPLLLEQRGMRWYLIAYCHNRRARRTFRADRIRLIDYPGEP